MTQEYRVYKTSSSARYDFRFPSIYGNTIIATTQNIAIGVYLHEEKRMLVHVDGNRVLKNRSIPHPFFKNTYFKIGTKAEMEGNVILQRPRTYYFTITGRTLMDSKILLEKAATSKCENEVYSRSLEELKNAFGEVRVEEDTNLDKALNKMLAEYYNRGRDDFVNGNVKIDQTILPENTPPHLSGIMPLVISSYKKGVRFQEGFAKLSVPATLESLIFS